MIINSILSYLSTYLTKTRPKLVYLLCLVIHDFLFKEAINNVNEYLNDLQSTNRKFCVSNDYNSTL